MPRSSESRGTSDLVVGIIVIIVIVFAVGLILGFAAGELIR